MDYEHRAFSGYGVEIEYMIVDQKSLDVLPVADRVLDAVGGAEDMDVERGAAAWSNELALHVIEVKTAGPARDLASCRQVFAKQVEEINALLKPLGGRLMPGAMHPWMQPEKETRLWPHQNDEIYRAFDRIFGCSGHGWSNLQSTHINFPFSTPDEFHRLHAACRFVLPLIPALAGSSPYMEGKRGPGVSSRLLVYRDNCRRVPSVTGHVIPERAYTEEAYQELLSGIYRDLAPLDPDGTLANEWVNARGCIARFDRGAIEIRLVDAQESPGQDLSVVSFLVEVVKGLSTGLFPGASRHEDWEEERLLEILLASAVKGRSARVPTAYAASFDSAAQMMGELLREIATKVQISAALSPGLEVILAQGSLAERLQRRLGIAPSKEALMEVYGALCDCLERDAPFVDAVAVGG